MSTTSNVLHVEHFNKVTNLLHVEHFYLLQCRRFWGTSL